MEAIEADFRRRLTIEFRKLATGGWSRYLADYSSEHPMGRFWRTPEMDQLERNERDVRRLRSKLGEPLDAGPLAVLEWFQASRRISKDFYRGRAEALAKEALRRLAAT
ncbi:MAG: hypothetical protein HY318_19470 [Armatimonadetes bacterium]|nr:hypothetical protein [Armatimonadota bacterium]